MTRKFIDLIPLDKRIEVMFFAEKMARERRLQFVAALQVQCEHVDVGNAWTKHDGTCRVCLRCGYFETPRSEWPGKLFCRADVFDITETEFYDRRLFTDR